LIKKKIIIDNYGMEKETWYIVLLGTEGHAYMFKILTVPHLADITKMKARVSL
jgi:hypothetical protein